MCSGRMSGRAMAGAVLTIVVELLSGMEESLEAMGMGPVLAMTVSAMVDKAK